MQQIQVIGNLGDDAQLVDLGSNKQVINFTIAHTEKLSNG